MKWIGVVLMIAGGVWAVIAFRMQTTVTTPGYVVGDIQVVGQTVSNIGLMEDRRNMLMMASVVAIIGTIMLASGRTSRGGIDESDALMSQGVKTCPFCAEKIRHEAVICRYCNHDVAKCDSGNASETMWLCRCGNENDTGVSTCPSCGRSPNAIV